MSPLLSVVMCSRLSIDWKISIASLPRLTRWNVLLSVATKNLQALRHMLLICAIRWIWLNSGPVGTAISTRCHRTQLRML